MNGFSYINLVVSSTFCFLNEMYFEIFLSSSFVFVSEVVRSSSLPLCLKLSAPKVIRSVASRLCMILIESMT